LYSPIKLTNSTYCSFDNLGFRGILKIFLIYFFP
jgi:hypothetical protein